MTQAPLRTDGQQSGDPAANAVCSAQSPQGRPNPRYPRARSVAPATPDTQSLRRSMPEAPAVAAEAAWAGCLRMPKQASKRPIPTRSQQDKRDSTLVLRGTTGCACGMAARTAATRRSPVRRRRRMDQQCQEQNPHERVSGQHVQQVTKGMNNAITRKPTKAPIPQHQQWSHASPTPWPLP